MNGKKADMKWTLADIILTLAAVLVVCAFLYMAWGDKAKEIATSIVNMF